MTIDPAQLQADALKIAQSSPNIRRFALDTAAYLAELDEDLVTLEERVTKAEAYLRGIDGRVQLLEHPAPPPPPPPPPPPATSRAVPFGAFLRGDLSEFADVTCHGDRVTVHTSGGPNNLPWARMTADQSCQCYGDAKTERLHLIGFRDDAPLWFTTGELWRGISLRRPSGFLDVPLFAGDELHASNQTVAPMHIAPTSGGYWWLDAVGGPAAGIPTESFAQYNFGPYDGPIYGGTYYRKAQPWLGGNVRVVNDEWVHFKVGIGYDAGAGNGWLEAYCAVGDKPLGWVPIVQRVTGLSLGYPLETGAPYPVIGIYRNVIAGTIKLDASNGWWAPSRPELDARQDPALGLAA